MFPYKPEIVDENVQQHENWIDCGVFSLVFSVCIALGLDPFTIHIYVPTGFWCIDWEHAVCRHCKDGKQKVRMEGYLLKHPKN